MLRSGLLRGNSAVRPGLVRPMVRRSQEMVPLPSFPSATGGTITDITDPHDGLAYRVHTFTEGGTFEVTDGGEFEVLVVGPGGPGGSIWGFTGAGGGAGGDVLQQTLNLSPGTNAITIGTSPAPTVNGPALGTATSALGLSARPGGRGGGWESVDILHDPTEGGGGHGFVNGDTAETANYTGATHTTSLEGGDGFEAGATANADRSGGGGRGAGGSGQDGDINGGGDGGPGVSSSIDGTEKTYGRGAGGGSRQKSGGAPNGAGGPAADGLPGVNSGDGGGGCAGGSSTSEQTGGPGADGIVIIRYRRAA